jgi:two-component system KDP operon response regulator KdpE
MADPAIVLIEDEAEIRRFLRVTLHAQGYRLFEAITGADGLVEVATRQPDIVIVDLGLPDMDGLEVIRRLREWSSVPVIVLSARGGERDKVTALDSGADDYIEKPFSTDELLACASRFAIAPAARATPTRCSRLASSSSIRRAASSRSTITPSISRRSSTRSSRSSSTTRARS